MRKINRIFLLLVLSFTISSFVFQEWYSYKDPGQILTISFPKKPEESKHVYKTAAGSVESLNVVYKSTSANEHNGRYLLSITPFQTVEVPKDKEKALLALKKGVDGSVRNHKGKLTSSIVKESTHPYIESEMLMNEGNIYVKMRHQLVGDKFIGLMVYTMVSKKGNPDIDKFLNSMSIN